jgi:hypothetical protein
LTNARTESDRRPSKATPPPPPPPPPPPLLQVPQIRHRYSTAALSLAASRPAPLHRHRHSLPVCTYHSQHEGQQRSQHLAGGDLQRRAPRLRLYLWIPHVSKACHLCEGSRLLAEYARFEVFTAVTKKNGVFWDVTPCGSCKNRRFGVP